jgi:uncharacterized protein
MVIVLAGASGFLGSRLRHRLTTDGHEIVQLVRSKPTRPDQRRWAPERGELDPVVLAGADAVVNLAGAGIGDKRWTDAYKRTLRDSRIDSTSTLATAIAALGPDQRPAVLVNSSAVGAYGDTGDTETDETAPRGSGFLPDLCRDWEAATEPAVQAGVRVALLRTGLPLDANGGLLKPMLLPFRLGLGARFGDGRQWIPWISMPDWLSAVRFVIDRPDVNGPVNVVGPAPARNADFTKAFGAALHRPALLWLPGFALYAGLGGFAEEALVSHRVVPGVLTKAGYAFRHPTLKAALAAALK